MQNIQNKNATNLATSLSLFWQLWSNTSFEPTFVSSQMALRQKKPLKPYTIGNKHREIRNICWLVSQIRVCSQSGNHVEETVVGSSQFGIKDRLFVFFFDFLYIILMFISYFFKSQNSTYRLKYYIYENCDILFSSFF